MAYNDNQNESALPVPGKNNKRTASDFLPKYFRTAANRKFLQGTLDQLIQPGVAEKLNFYAGRETAKSFQADDLYLNDVSNNRKNYQLEPALVIKDDLDNVKYYKDYNDYMNQLSNFGANTRDHSRVNTQESYAWNPNIDWDKFVNFREYYWLPNGPMSVNVRGQSKEVTSTYTVTLADNVDNVSYLFSPDGLTSNPTLKLFRGQTYKFEIDTPGYPIAFAISRTFTPGSAIVQAGNEGIRDNGTFGGTLFDETGTTYDVGGFIVEPSAGGVLGFEDDDNVSTLYPDGISKFDENGNEIEIVWVEKGTIEFTIPDNAPDRLYYISRNNIDTSGLIRIYDIEENSFLDVANEVLGKKTYTSANGVTFSNGMKISFQGDITPDVYEENEWFIEGVGDKIRLVRDVDLTIPSAYSQNIQVPFDSVGFDNLPFANASAYAADKDYLVINRASQDRNPWSRYNKWFHRDVIEQSFTYNNTPVEIDQDARAKRPVIEFEAGLKLFNFGTEAKQDVDVVDTFTKDVFSTIEGKEGYNIDGVELAEGMRVLFTADTDILVSGKIYQVKFIKIGNTRQISLVETDDTAPLENETAFVTQGNKYAGQTFYFNGSIWNQAQQKTKRNQPPLFDLCCPFGSEYADVTTFESSTFSGTKVFSYREGTGTDDSELGFPLTYRTIENSGDIVFDFNLLNDSFTYQLDEELITVTTDTSNLRKYTSRDTFNYVNGYSSIPTQSKQYVIRQYVADELSLNNYAIDVYDNAGDLNDLKVVVYVNNKIKFEFTDFEIDRVNKKALVRFYNDLNENDVVKIKTSSSTAKNSNGYYEFPYNLERNPLNDDITEFTLGEVIDHVDTMIEEINGFAGTYPGISNLRDLGDLDRFGKRFVKHSGPINLPLYHTTSKKYNIINAIRYSKQEYAKFKRIFLETAEKLGLDTLPKQHVDAILKEINKDKIKSQPFYFSDMIPVGANNAIEYKVLDSRTRLYALSNDFNLASLSPKAVLVYLNNKQLKHGLDYNFDNQGFVSIDAAQQVNDIITIYEYESTDGSYVAPTPTKLGLFPKYEPQLLIDDTYRTSEPITTGPFKIYGEVAEGYFRAGTRGWFYPVFTTEAAAQEYAEQQGLQVTTSHTHQFLGLNRVFYMPNIGGTHGGQDNPSFDTYPVGIPMIKGHDGSYIRAYLDYRDELLIELENRIFNNIKIDYDINKIDIKTFEGGEFRNSLFTREEINNTLLGDFTEWLQLVDNDYTDNFFYLRQNEFTFNYGSFSSPTGKSLAGFWRGTYNYIYDTDTPHSTPWEMLGFTIKPEWWNETYGPAPYTRENNILWKDLEEGIVRKPNQPIEYRPNYARPNLRNFIPVDSQGQLKAPLAAGVVNGFVLRQTSDNFTFGDQSPVEAAWRRSSEYPFAIITSYLLNNPAKALGLGFDLSRIERNLAGQWSYTETQKPLQLNNVLLPNTYQSSQRIQTSGFVNYIYNLISSDILSVYNEYIDDISRITNQLGFKLGGFTDKQKINLLLDSKSPQQVQTDGGIFVPQENYKVFLNTSSPIDIITYSGIVIEKISSGFVIRGYNQNDPVFKYYDYINSSKTIPVTVGGISEATTLWESGKRYEKGTVVENNNSYYRVVTTFTAGEQFDTENLAKLPGLPTVGGKTALFRRNFNKRQIKLLSYGSKLNTSQEVVDFILGYGEYLKAQGFTFDNVEVDGLVENWDKSAREFLFWTTQGWASGTVLSISPSAGKLEFDPIYSVVDNLSDPFYPYSILKSNGDPLDTAFTTLLRDGNSFGIQTEVKNDEEGLYNVSLPLVQKEHVVLLDNSTIFNDVIYKPETGYRQERLKVLGYRSDEWEGGLNIPGFVYDDAKVVDWETWEDYTIGSIVKFKQFYYVATKNVTGAAEFDPTGWYRLSEKPESELVTNFDYRINQFADFYDLDTAGFDEELQKMAQHLTAYQKRDYLANIINDDVSQYKFYQGFIQDKGTKNALDKLFKKLSSANKESLEFYEEWALQVGRYGATDNVEQVEFNLEENKMVESPQIIELAERLPETNFEKIYRILPQEVHDKPLDYDHDPFPTTVLNIDAKSSVVKSGGYVAEDDVTYIAGTIGELAGTDTNLISLADYIWIPGFRDQEWAVFQNTDSGLRVNRVVKTGRTASTGEFIAEVYTNKWAANFVTEDDLISIRGSQTQRITGIYKINSINLDKIEILLPSNNFIQFADEDFMLTKLRNVRVADLESLNDLVQENIYTGQKIWVDDFDNNGNWSVVENTRQFTRSNSISNPTEFDSTRHEFSKSIAASSNNLDVFIGAPGDQNGKVHVFKRTKENWDLRNTQELGFNLYPLEWKPNTQFFVSNKIAYYNELTSKWEYYVATKTHVSGSTLNKQLIDGEDFTPINPLWRSVSDPIEFLNPIGSNFGESVAASPDGEYVVVGIPNASEVKTRDKGDFDPSQTYTKNDIVRYRSSLWKANREILPEISAQPFSTFDSYNNIISASDADSTSITLLMTADPGINRNIADGDDSLKHFLVKAPKDMYLGTKPNDRVTLYWNAVSYAYPTLDPNKPFDGEIDNIDFVSLSKTHTIEEKIDHVFFFDTFVTIPNVGDTIENDTGSAEVHYVSVKDDSMVVYVKNTNGIFGISGELFTVDENFLGFYEEQGYSTSDNLGGFWFINNYDAENPADPNNFVYYNNGRYFDQGKGLVYVDVQVSDDQSDPNPYYNIQGTIQEIGPYVTKKNQVSFITQLSFEGDLGGVESIYPSDLWVVRAGKEFTNTIDAGDTIEFELFEGDNRVVDFTNTGLSYDVINGTQTVQEKWDGYIDFDLVPGRTGDVFEPKADWEFDAGSNNFVYVGDGDTVEDAQIPFDEFGGLAATNSTTSSAKVKFVQRNFNRLRVYLEIIEGTFAELNNIGSYQLRRVREGAADRIMGIVDDTNNNINLGTEKVGELIVFRNTETFDAFSEWNNVVPLVDEEYIIYNEGSDVDGVSRVANPPYSLNKDYTQIYNIPADKSGTAGPDNEGAIAIYRRKRGGTYELQRILVSEYRATDRQFGKHIQIAQDESYYTLMVSSDPVGLARDQEGEWRTNPGSIEIFRHGSKDINFAGEYQFREYSEGEVVTFKDNYYEAIKDSPIDEDLQFIKNSLYWKNISWRRSTDENFRGEFNSAQSYATGNIVEFNNNLYSALTNISQGAAWNIADWNLIDYKIDYIGYLPNLTGKAYFDEEVFDPIENIDQFAQSFSLSEDANTLVVSSRQTETDSTETIKVIVYKQFNDKYMVSQIIERPADADKESWGQQVTINPQGTSFAVSANLADNIKNDQGLVYVYSLGTDGFFGVSGNPTQTLASPNNEVAEQFGHKIHFGNDNLVITSLNGDQLIPTRFDTKTEYVDSYLVGYDSGIDLRSLNDILFKSVVDGVSEYRDYKLYTNDLINYFGKTYKVLVDTVYNPSSFDVTNTSTFIEIEPQPIYVDTVFDSTSADSENETTFDSGFTTFQNIKLDTGVVYVYENLSDRLVYAESFRYENAGVEFGENIHSVNNHVYVGMTDQLLNSTKGIVLDYRKGKGLSSWNKIRESIPAVDITKIRGAFLYNKRTDQIVSYIDYIDPIQGKIAGPADQDITYKTGFDPAKYNTGATADSSVDKDLAWGEDHVGQVWWNIHSARFAYPYQGSSVEQRDQWNRLLPGSSIDVYEWVESRYPPSQWDEISGTDQGIIEGIDGRSLYGDTKFTTKLEYDDIAKVFNTKFYFWVGNSKVVPQTNNRTLNTRDIARFISRPREQGYRFISFIGSNKFILNNFDNLINSDDLVLNIKYATNDNLEQNVHSQYQLISDGLETSVPNADIERKWFDSLIGFDTNGRQVPDTKVPVKTRYGVQNRPRQSMFVNRFEALKQYIERVNSVLKENLIVDLYDFSALDQKEALPEFINGDYDIAIDSYSELRFVSTNKIQQAELTPVINNGKITNVLITNPGRGYKVAPSFEISGANTGTGADIELEINNLGQIVNVIINNQGSGYAETTRIFVRKFSVLINSDTTIFDKWSIYGYDESTRTWFRRSIQDYDVTQYWDYVDWYAEGYNEFTEIDEVIDQTYQLTSLDNTIKSVVKIKNVGTGGWLLLEKINNEDTSDYTVNYKTIGRENGTIQFKDTLYDYGKNTVGYSNRSFDSFFYDNNPAKELRIILDTIKDNLFVSDLRVNYNQLFLASLRYILSEQNSVDWMFKTSFVNATHNLGELFQDITFNADNLDNYKEYVEEVKPFKTNIREYVSAYEKTEPTNTSISDFDLAPIYDSFSNSIQASSAYVSNGVATGLDDSFDEHPRKQWLDNYGYQIKEILISDAGEGYTYKPVVKIISDVGTGATAEAFLGYGKVTKVKITNPGTGYTKAPTILIEGPLSDNGRLATATAVLGNSVVRTPSIRIKFDRTAGTYFIEDLFETETFTGSEFESRFDLKWPMDINTKKVKVYLDGIEQLRSTYTFENLENTDAGYTRSQGRVIFTTPPALNTSIVVEYYKPLDMLGAEDRIKHAYNPLTTMFGNDLAQLMTGVDYGGVEIRGFEFETAAGWDSQGWYTDTWDTFSSVFEDEIFTADESTVAVELSQPLEQDIVYNVYRKSAGAEIAVRLDDPDFDAGTPSNTDAIMNSITGDGVTDVIDLTQYGILLLDGDTLIVRKITSEGVANIDTESYDQQLSGGDLAYTTATGKNAEDIVVDGDGFQSVAAQGGPEELVPGQVYDTLDIKVYTKESSGQGVIFSQNYDMDASVSTYNLGTTPGSSDSVFVKVDNVILDSDSYSIDYDNNTVTVDNPQDDVDLSIITISQSTQNIVDFGKLYGDISTTDYETSIYYVPTLNAAGEPETPINEVYDVFANINGIAESVVLVEQYAPGYINIRFESTLLNEDVINYTIFEGTEQVNYSQITKDSFVGDGSTIEFELATAPFYALPTQHNIMVKVDNRILNAGYNIQYTIPENNQREYQLETFQQPAGSTQASDLEIYLNGELIETPVEWRFDINNASVILSDETGLPGDLLEIYIITDGEYSISGNTVTLKETPANSSTIDIFQFSNHDLLNIERQQYDVVNREIVELTGDDYVTYQRLSVGEIQLRKPAHDAQYVWIARNGEMLTPSVDYYVTDDKTKVRIVRNLDENDILDIIHFSAPLNQPKFAFRQFKDILNRTHFKRLDAAATELAQPLAYHDLRIEVLDGTALADPDKGRNMPGIIFINGERIEYFVKEENTLRQIRRGTLGTGIPEVHASSSNVYDQNNSKTVPYQDKTFVHNFRNEVDGNNKTFTIPFVVGSKDEIEVFSAGKRLRKLAVQEFDPTLALDSPDGDITINEEFTFDAATNSITITETPTANTLVTVIKKTLQPWTDAGIMLGDAQNNIGRFLQAGSAGLPE